jgi:anti-anti-sigma factor
VVTRTPVSDEEVVVEVHGALHGEPATDFQNELDGLLGLPYRTITLNLADVASINSSSIGKILLSRKKLAEQGRSIRIEGCSDPLYGTFQLIRLDRLVPVRR